MNNKKLCCYLSMFKRPFPLKTCCLLINTDKEYGFVCNSIRINLLRGLFD